MNVVEPQGRLAGVRVLVTRPRERAEELCFLLEDEGAEVHALPLLELLPPEDPRPLRSAAEHVHRYAWVAFASPSAVEALVEATRQAGTLGHLAKARLAAVGPQTARALERSGLPVAREAQVATGRGLYEALRELLQPGDEILLPAAEDGRRELSEALQEAGFGVSRVCAYRSAASALDPAALARLSERPPQVVFFGSPRTAEAFLETLGEQGRRLAEGARVVAMGPTTAGAVERLGLRVAAVASRPTSEGLVEAAISAVRG
jgi:uroporphyrinogen-III synthase